MNAAAKKPARARVVVFIDLPGFLDDLGDASTPESALDWEGFPRWVAVEAASAALLSPMECLSYAGALVYVVDDPSNRSGGGQVAEVIVRLSRDPLVEIRVVRAGPAALGECRACDLAGTPRCHRCRNMSAPSSLLGGAVGNAITTDIFRMLREDSLDIAVLLSSGRGLVHVARAVEVRGKRIVHAAFPPRGRDLSDAASGVIDLSALRP